MVKKPNSRTIFFDIPRTMFNQSFGIKVNIFWNVFFDGG